MRRISPTPHFIVSSMAAPRATRVNMSGMMNVVRTSWAAGDIGPGWPKNAEIAEIDEIAVVLPREDLADEVDEVVTGAGRELRRIPRGQLQVRNVIDAD